MISPVIAAEGVLHASGNPGENAKRRVVQAPSERTMSSQTVWVRTLVI
jgi:hypothetical protein